MSHLTRQQVVRVVGELDDLVLSRIVATGVSEEELEEATVEAEASVTQGEETPNPSSARVAEVRAILEDLLASEADESGYD